LFLQIKEVKFIDLSKTIIDERVLLVVILLSMMIMTLGTMKKTVDKDETDFLENTEEANTNSLDKFLDEIANEKDDLT
jgi:hypothetical protein